MPINQKWLREGPELTELIGEIRDERNGRRKKAAIVIPTRNGNDLTGEHLRLLSRQTCRDFDAIIVYGENDGFLPHTHGIPAVHLKRNDDYGSAGGFYAGEKFAIENGYETIILADNDCLPESASLVKDLLKAIDEGADVVVPRVRNTDGRKPGYNYILPQYGCMRARMLKDVGLAYLPFYFAGEDVEFLYRIKKHGYQIGHVNSTAYHPDIGSPFAYPLAKFRYYIRADTLCCYLVYPFSKACPKILLYTLGGLFLAPFKRELAGTTREYVIHGSMMRFFKLDACMHDATRLQEYKSASGAEVYCLAYDWNPDEKLFGNIGGMASAVMKYLAQIPGIIGKDIVFKGMIGLSGMALAFLARTSWRRENWKYYPILENNRFYLFPLYAVFFLAMFLLAIPMTLALMSIGYARRFSLGINPVGYGTTS